MQTVHYPSSREVRALAQGGAYLYAAGETCVGDLYPAFFPSEAGSRLDLEATTGQASSDKAFHGIANAFAAVFSRLEGFDPDIKESVRTTVNPKIDAYFWGAVKNLAARASVKGGRAYLEVEWEVIALLTACRFDVFTLSRSMGGDLPALKKTTLRVRAYEDDIPEPERAGGPLTVATPQFGRLLLPFSHGLGAPYIPVGERTFVAVDRESFALRIEGSEAPALEAALTRREAGTGPSRAVRPPVWRKQREKEAVPA